MPEPTLPDRGRHPYEYTVIRIVPRVERGETLNVGVILNCRGTRFLAARFHLDPARLAAFAPHIDPETVAMLEQQIAAITRICAGDLSAGPIARLGLGERWHWLSAPANTMLQPGAVHTGLTADPAACLERLFADLVAI